MTDYKNWKISQSEADNKAEEYAAAAAWCNQNQQYRIVENGDCYEVQPIPEPTSEEKAAFVRSRRDYFLAEYIDKYAANSLYWAELSELQRQDIATYRRYLLDIPQSAEFPEIKVKTFEEWKNDGNSAE